MKILTYILLLLVAVVCVAFASLNAETVFFNYYFGIKQFPLSLLLILSFVIGSLIGLFFGLLIYFKTKRQLKKRIKMAEKEIASLRSMSLDNRY